SSCVRLFRMVSRPRAVYTLSLHDALPIFAVLEKHGGLRLADQDVFASAVGGLKIIEPAADLALCLAIAGAHYRRAMPPGVAVARSEEHTSELQSRENLVCRLLLEKKKQTQ